MTREDHHIHTEHAAGRWARTLAREDAETRYDGLTDCPWCADDPSGACSDCRAALDAEEAGERAEDARREGSG